MRILIAASEAVPYAKTGGLADVAGSLLKVFRSMKMKASLILPLYSLIKEKYRLYNTGKEISIKMGDIIFNATIFASDNSDFPEAYFIDCDKFYGRPEIYGTPESEYPDNALRYIFFSRGILEACIKLNISPDLIHCNDWQTAMIPLYLKSLYSNIKNFKNTASLLTIHNLGYQGVYDKNNMVYTGLGWEYFTMDSLEFYDNINMLKAGIVYSDLINTVSPTYAKEILLPQNGFGLDGVLRKRSKDLYGVLNGIDYKEWDPSKDSLIPFKYNKTDLKGKRKCKERLLKVTGLKDTNMPVIGIVSRLSSQKGIDLLTDGIDRIVALGVNIVILGKGEDYYHKILLKTSERQRNRLFVKIGFEDTFAHLIYAGSDFFIMPSRYEPCGLGQIIALRYGTIPIARSTGGIVDTVRDYNHLESTGTGFLFDDYTSSALVDAVKRALCVYVAGDNMKGIISQAMSADFSWKASAEKYLELYTKALKKVMK